MVRIFMKSFVKENPITGTIEIMQLFVPCFSSLCHLSSSNYMLSTSSTIAAKEKPNRFGRFTFHAFDYTPPDDRRLGRPVSRMAESHTAGPALFFSLPKEKRKKRPIQLIPRHGTLKHRLHLANLQTSWPATMTRC